MAEPVEKKLKGGNTTPVARVGDDVLREAGPWTPTVQRLLSHLRDNGVNWCPEPQGWSPDGREAVSYIKGKVPKLPFPDWMYEDDVLVTAAQWMRQLHDLTADFDEPDFVWRSPRRKPAEVVCHNDFMPFNMVFKDQKLVGIIDWDLASPGPRIWDLAFLAYWMVPLMRPESPWAPKIKVNLKARMTLLLEAYDTDYSVREVGAATIARLTDKAAFVAGRAHRSDYADELNEEAANFRADADFLKSFLL